MKGQNLRIFIKQGSAAAKCVAYSTSCTYHLSATLEDSSTKDDAGGFQKQEVTGMAGDFSCDALYSVATDSTGVNGEDALDLLLAGQEVTIEFSATSFFCSRFCSRYIFASMSMNSQSRCGHSLINEIERIVDPSVTKPRLTRLMNSFTKDS